MVTLKTPARSDLAYIKNLWACTETNKHTGGPYPMKDEAAWFSRWIEPGSPDRLYFLICNQEEVPVGEVCFHSFDPTDKSAWFNIKIEAANQGNNYARDAIRQMLHTYFFDFGGEVMYDDIALENFPGQQALLKFGFEHDPSRNEVFLVKMTKQAFLNTYAKDPAE